MATGAGLYVACGPTPDGAVAAWYDAAAGAIATVRGPQGDGSVDWLDGTPEPLDGSDRGRHAALTTSPEGAVTIVYQDVVEGRVLAATQSGEGDDWIVDVVHDGLVEGGLHALGTGIAASRLGDGTTLAVYGDGSTGSLWLAARGDGPCWHRVRVLSEGTWVWPALTMVEAETVGVSSVRLGLDQTLTLERELHIVQLTAPSGTCSDP